MITGYFVDAEKKIAEVRTVEAGLESYYKLLNCRYIDIPMRKIAGRYYDIICDDEGLMKAAPEVTMYNRQSGEPMLVGNLFICNHDGEGHLVSLTEEDVKLISGQIGCVNGETAFIVGDY